MDVELGRSRSRSGWAHVKGVVTSPSDTYGADIGTAFWGFAYLFACVVSFLSILVDVRAGEPALALAGTPIGAGVVLLLQRVITAVACRVCGGDPDLNSATASQAAIVAGLTALPAVLISLLLPPSMPEAAYSLVVVVLAVGTLVAEFWLIGLLYSKAYFCSVGRGVLGEIVGLIAVIAGIMAAVLLLALLLG